MIPYKDENPTHHIPYVTYAIIILNILAWFLLQGMGKEPVLTQSICNFGVIPGAVLGSAVFQSSPGFCNIAEQTWWVSLSSMFMHGGWMHLIGNMWFLWIFADNIEDVLRPFKFIVFYLLGGFAAVAAQMVADSGSLVPMVGASGAIGGVMGAYIWLYPHVRVHLAIILGFFIFRQTVPAWVMLGIWLLIQLVGGYMSYTSSSQGGVAFWAHIGGFAAGFFLIQLFHSKSPRRIK